MKKLLAIFTCLGALGCFAGCGKSTVPETTSAPAHDMQDNSGANSPAHGHGTGPHGGTLTDWGGGAYHVEFTVNHDTKEAIAYILGSDEKSPSPIKAEMIQLVINDPMTELELRAAPLEGELAGTSSRFMGVHDTIGIVREFSGTISAAIEGTPYMGDFSEEPNDPDHSHQ